MIVDPGLPGDRRRCINLGVSGGDLGNHAGEADEQVNDPSDQAFRSFVEHLLNGVGEFIRVVG